jgi:hypothetical protein
MENIKVIKMLSGEEVVAGVEERPDTLLLKSPVKFVMTPISQSQMGIEMQPYVVLSKDTEVEVSLKFVVAICDPVEEVAESYQSQFSELVIPPEKRLVT